MPGADERSDRSTTPLLLVDVDGVLNAVVGTPRRLLAFHADCQPLAEVAAPAPDVDGGAAALG